MVTDMRLVISCTRTESSWEKDQLIQSSRGIFDDVVSVNPTDLAFEFINGRPSAAFLPNGQSVIGDALITRSTYKGAEASALLFEVLSSEGAASLDPKSRYSGRPPSKTFTTPGRHERAVGSDTAIIFSEESAQEVVQRWLKSGAVVLKPTDGKGGVGVSSFSDYSKAKPAIERHFSVSEAPLLLQRLEPIEAEFRVMVLNHELLAGALKVQQSGQLAANASQGAAFQRADVTSLHEWIVDSGLELGLFGVDVARRKDGSLFVIEENHSPQWRALQAATGVSISDRIIESLALSIGTLRSS